ncbi:MAG: putative metal-dependent protease of the superfamily [Planctomycetota bacterium]|nr:putative metal-dependent protease of the superfamily [Planctomycetota bacterium]
MSDEEIQFEDVAYREPLKARRPDLDPRVACIAYRVPQHEDLPIFLDRKTADAIERHALRDTSVELGGILLGKECVDEVTGLPFVWVTEALEAKHYENTQASFTYTHDSWEEITRERDAKHPELDIVGWYHTHPDFGIFLSSHDLFIHHNFFDQPLQVAYVVDPIRQDRGFFQWKDGRMVQVGGFWLCDERGDRMALARFVNELEGIPTADGGGGGGGLSPRLEAELFAMLSRPQTVAVATDRGQSAAVFSLLGMFVGALAVAGFIWLQTLGRTLVDQSEAIKSLKVAQEKSTVSSRDQITAERVSAKEAALDAILHDVKVDPASPKLSARLSEVLAQRDEAQRAMGRLKVEKDALADKTVALDHEVLAIKINTDAEREKAKKNEEELRQKNADLTKQNDELQDVAEEYKRMAKDNGLSDLRKKYQWAWYLALAGWCGFAASGIGLAAALARGESDDHDRPSNSEPPHTTISIT